MSKGTYNTLTKLYYVGKRQTDGRTDKHQKASFHYVGGSLII